MLKITQYAPLSLLCVYISKLMIMGASLSDGLVIAVFSGLTAFLLHKTEDQRLSKIEKELKLLHEEIASKNKLIDEMKNHVAGLKLGQQIRVQR